MEARDYPAACAKLAESSRLDPGAGGTLMNLAACHELEGKTATAWAEFTDALSFAARDGRQDRILEARRKIAELAPKLARISVLVDPGSPAPQVRLDGNLLGPASWGTPFPADPGPHDVTATSPGCVPWTARVQLTGGSTAVARVPRLQRTAAETSPAVVALPPSGNLPIAGLVVGGAGVAALGVGIVSGVVAASRKHESEAHCAVEGHTCDPSGAALLHEANTAAWVSDVGFGVGIGALAVATYLVVSELRRAPAAPGSPSLTTLVVPSPGSIGLGLRASW